MKKFPISILFIFLSHSIICQIFIGGFKGGLCGSQVSGDMLVGFNKAGIYAGTYAGFFLNDNMRIQLEMQYIQKGSRQNPNPEKYKRKYLLRLNYIELPVILTWRTNTYFEIKDILKRKTEQLTPRRANTYFEIEGGLSYGLLMKNNNPDDDNIGIEWDDNGLMPGAREFRKYEIAFHLGLNYLLNENVMINFRFMNSLLPIREHTGGATYWFNRGQYITALTLWVNYFIGKE